MVFTDGIVICSKSMAQLEGQRGMKIIRSKTECMFLNEWGTSGTVEEFKYLS